MRRVILTSVFLAAPALAQEAPPPALDQQEAPPPALAQQEASPPALDQEAPPTDEGWGLMERGARLLLEGLMDEVAPTLDEMGRTLTEMEPAVRDLLAMLGDIRNYHAPERLPNGDILIRRKPAVDVEGLTGPEIEL